MAGHIGHPRTASPEQVAIALEKMRAGKKAAEARRAALVDQVIDLGGADLATLRRSVKNRHWEVVMWHLGGYSNEQIARSMGYADRGAVMNVLRRPEIARLVDLVRQEQLRRVIEGEFGVRAQAKAAAPKVMRRVIEKAGAIEVEGKPVGMAAKDQDQLRAADMVLTVSGDKIERHLHGHVHVMQQMNDEELRAYADRGVWPARLGPEPRALMGAAE